MDDSLQSHSDYFDRHGPLRWFLRECVRANPFYVFSAATLSYGVLQLNAEVDPQVGKLRGIVTALLLLHVYEFCLLIAATIVLRRRGEEGGRDLHGLTIVATLFLGGSLVALDELIALYNRDAGMVCALIAGTLVLAGLKLMVYARQPGVYLPLRHRAGALLVLTAHSVSALLGLETLRDSWGVGVTQGLSWLCGWLSFVVVFALVTLEGRTPEIKEVPREVMSLDEVAAPKPVVDALQTGWSGAWLIALSMGLGIVHLFSADWVFDRSTEFARVLPAAVQLAAIVMLLRWQRRRAMTVRSFALCVAPVALAHLYGATHSPQFNAGPLMMFAGLTVQLGLSAAVFYVALAISTRNPMYLTGLAGLVAAPVVLLWQRFRAVASIGLGFVLLGAGVVLSLHRQRLLAYFERTGFERKVKADFEQTLP